MPQRPSKNFLVPVKGLDLAADIRKAWQEKKFRPTIVFIGVGQVSHGVYAVPFVSYENGPAGQLVLLQSPLQAKTSISEATWIMICDAFTVTVPPKREQPLVSCIGYYDYRMPAGRRPDGFSHGKRYFFVTMDTDELSLSARPGVFQKDENPVRALYPHIGLQQIRHTLSFISDEGKRWACVEAVEAALQERFDKDHVNTRKSA